MYNDFVLMHVLVVVGLCVVVGLLARLVKVLKELHCDVYDIKFLAGDYMYDVKKGVKDE